MPTIHLHIVGAKPDGVQCIPAHIPGAKVHIEGSWGLFCVDRFVGDYVADANGIVNFSLLNTCYDLSIGATTPKGRHAEMRQTGAFSYETDVTWVLGVPGACDETSAAADAGAILGGYAWVFPVLVLAGVVIGGYLLYRVLSGGRGRRIYEGGREAVRYVRRR